MMFAQISPVPSEFLKDLLLSAAGVAALGYYVKQIFWGDKPTTTKIEPDPVRIEKVYPSATLREVHEKFDEHGRRLDRCDLEITSIWNTMREEDKGIRKDLADKFENISRALGRIEGKLNRD